jgi:hypothetical protein
MVWLRTTRNRFTRAGELNYSPQNSRSQIWNSNNAKAPPFDLSQYRRVGMGDDAACVQRNADTVISHQPCEIACLFRRRDQARCKSAFSGAGWPANEDAGLPNHNRGCVEIG